MLKAKQDVPASVIDKKAGRVILSVSTNNNGDKEVWVNFQFPGVDSRILLTQQEAVQVRNFLLPIAQRISDLHTVEVES